VKYCYIIYNFFTFVNTSVLELAHIRVVTTEFPDITVNIMLNLVVIGDMHEFNKRKNPCTHQEKEYNGIE
jgi:hypothetical protein